MIARSRRDALMLLGAMAGASALAALGRPTPYRSTDGAPIDLDRMFPQAFGGWYLDDSTLALVRPATTEGKRYGIYDQVLERTFIDSHGQRVMLSVVFGSEQSAALQLHRPEVCYRASGYQVRGTRGGTLELADQSVAVTRLLAEMPGRLEPITYWTLLGGKVVSDLTSFRWLRLEFAFQRMLVDGILVRVSSINVEPAAAFELQGRFADGLVRAMAPADRMRITGRPGST